MADELDVARDPVVCDADGLVEALAPVLGVAPPAPAVLLAETVDVAEPVTEGENTAGGDDEDEDEDEPVVQPETPAAPSTAKVHQPMAVSLTLSAVPAMVVRTFIEPSSCAARYRYRFLVPASETASAREIARPAWSLPTPAEGTVSLNADDDKHKPHGRHRHAMARSPPKY